MNEKPAKDMTPFARWMHEMYFDTTAQAAAALDISTDHARNLRAGATRGTDAKAVSPDRRTSLAMAALLAGLKPYV